MTDPVTTEDGYTYERSAIEKWFQTKNTSPQTGIPISTRLIPNFSLRSLLEREGYPVVGINKSRINNQLNDNQLNDNQSGITLPSTEGIKLLLLLDVSGSMDSAATNKPTFEPTFSRLDLIKHSVLAIGEMLRPNDQLCIVEFNNDTRITMDWTSMDSSGRRNARQCTGRLCTSGNTNIKKGLLCAIRENPQHIILLTDGENSTPITNLDFLSNYSGTIHTVGIGMSPDLNTELLRDISSFKHGLYCYCPDQSMVGSVFIHLVANICVNEQGETFDEYDDFIYKLIYTHTNKRLHKDLEPMVYSGILNLVGRENYVPKYFKNPILNEEFVSSDPNKGQISLAIKKKEWKEWGRHYLPALIDAHLSRMTTNFKDASIQSYASPRTREFISAGEVIFAQIEPPVPSCNNPMRATINTTAFVQTTLDRNGACFAPCTTIDTPRGPVPIAGLRKGSQVNTTGGVATVLCVVRSKKNEMVKIGDFWITPSHPIWLDNNWVHPLEIIGSISFETHDCYNLVLDKHHVVFLGSYKIPAVCLGHGLKGHVVEHDYYGSERVIRDLEKYGGWKTGFVIVQ
jgi:hypothetical protein